MAFAGNGNALADRRLIGEEAVPFPLDPAEEPGLAIAGATAEEPGPADHKTVTVAEAQPTGAQLGLPILGRIEAGLLDLGDDLVDLARRQSRGRQGLAVRQGGDGGGLRRRRRVETQHAQRTAE